MPQLHPRTSHQLRLVPGRMCSSNSENSTLAGLLVRIQMLEGQLDVLPRMSSARFMIQLDVLAPVASPSARVRLRFPCLSQLMSVRRRIVRRRLPTMGGLGRKFLPGNYLASKVVRNLESPFILCRFKQMGVFWQALIILPVQTIRELIGRYIDADRISSALCIWKAVSHSRRFVCSPIARGAHPIGSLRGGRAWVLVDERARFPCDNRQTRHGSLRKADLCWRLEAGSFERTRLVT